MASGDRGIGGHACGDVGVPQLPGSGGPDGVTGTGGSNTGGGAVVVVDMVVVVVVAGGGVHAASARVATIQRECLIRAPPASTSERLLREHDRLRVPFVPGIQ